METVKLILLPGLSRPPQEGALCLCEQGKPCSGVLLVLCINQGILASFSFSLSYRLLLTTRFWSIKGPQHSSNIFSHTTLLKSDFFYVPFLIARRACKNMHVCVQNRLTWVLCLYRKAHSYDLVFIMIVEGIALCM